MKRDAAWYRFVFDGDYAELIREQVKAEREEQGLPETVEVEVEE